MATPAERALLAGGVPYVAHAYRVAEAVGDGYGEAVAAALGVDPRRVFKTLFVRAGEEFLVAIIPVTGHLSWRALGRLHGVTRVTLAEPGDVHRRTGYRPGGVSPLGQRRPHPTYLDISAVDHGTIFVNGGRRGSQIELAPGDLITLTGAKTGRLTR
jgi:Cys-tRNA(Pro)/Cys-tRNA(Cys) deacylase